MLYMMLDPKATIKQLTRSILLRVTNRGLVTTRLRNRGDKYGEIKRIVVVRPDHLGDLLFATPALEQVRTAFPEAYITGLVGPWGRAMWEGNPNLDALQVVRFPGIVAESRGGVLEPYRLLHETAGKLAEGKYDLGIMLRFDHWWGAALLAAAGVPRRWGYDTRGVACRLTNAVRYVAGQHEVEQNLALVEAALMGEKASHATFLKIDRRRGVPKLRPPRGIPPVTDLLRGWLDAPRRAVIHPGTAAVNKLWTIEGWAEITRWLLADGWAVVITGAPDERALADAVMERVGSNKGIMQPMVNLAGETTSLGQLIWVLEKASMVLGVDSGPLHIADALGKPSLHLYGPSDERIWGPWGDPALHRTCRAPGTRPTMRLDVGSAELEGGGEMRAITPEMVMREINLLLQDTA